MKKMITAILTVIMMLTAMTCFAEIGSEPFELPHNTMEVWIDGDYYDFELLEVSIDEDSIIYATYIEENSEYALIVALDSWLGAEVYYAEDQSRDIMAFMLMEADGSFHYSHCHAPSVKDGDYSDFVLTVSDEDGWYQGGMIGYTLCEETGETHYVQVIFDFVLR